MAKILLITFGSDGIIRGKKGQKSLKNRLKNAGHIVTHAACPTSTMAPINASHADRLAQYDRVVVYEGRGSSWRNADFVDWARGLSDQLPPESRVWVLGLFDASTEYKLDTYGQISYLHASILWVEGGWENFMRWLADPWHGSLEKPSYGDDDDDD